MGKVNSIGRNISRIRELRGLKQDVLAFELGISQQAISKMEQSSEIEEVTLSKVANVLGVSKQAILQFSDGALNEYLNHMNLEHIVQNDFLCSFNPIDKLMEALEANKALYERLLASEREKIEILKGK